jgi:hypothetical protein
VSSPINCSGKYSARTEENREHWRVFFKTRDDPLFYNNLMKYCTDLGLTEFEPVNIPETEAKTDIMDASISPVDAFIKVNYRQFVEEWNCEEIR